MRNLKEIKKDIDELKNELNSASKNFGFDSVEYAELKEELDNLNDEYSFSDLHYEY